MARQQSRLEEKWNSLTHGSMALFLFTTLPFVLIYLSSRTHTITLRDITAVSIFILCLIFMFTTSAIYHGLRADSKYKPILNRLDHMSIFFAIAGSYTPLVLSFLEGKAALAVLIVEWSLVIIGVLFKSLYFKKNLFAWIVSILLYLAMGWAIVFCLPYFIDTVSPACFGLILTGGIFYTVGILFFAIPKRFSHVIWHFFVNAGAISHFLAIVFFMK